MQKTCWPYTAHYNLPGARRGFITVVHSSEDKKVDPDNYEGRQVNGIVSFLITQSGKEVAKPLIIFKSLAPLRDIFQTETLPG